MDHMGDHDLNLSVSSQKRGLLICDEFSGMVFIHICSNLASTGITEGLRFFAGTELDKVLVLCSDGAKAFRRASRALGVAHRRSTPNRPNTNSRCERKMQTVKDGGASLLLQSGLDSRFYLLAVSSFATTFNYQGDESADAPIVKRYGKDLREQGGRMLPFGSQISYVPGLRESGVAPRA